jgi:hypothetical protein
MAAAPEKKCPIIGRECTENECAFYVLTNEKTYDFQCAIIFSARKHRVLEFEISEIKKLIKQN